MPPRVASNVVVPERAAEANPMAVNTSAGNPPRQTMDRLAASKDGRTIRGLEGRGFGLISDILGLASHLQQFVYELCGIADCEEVRDR